jgi:hypothetical protein
VQNREYGDIRSKLFVKPRIASITSLPFGRVQWLVPGPGLVALYIIFLQLIFFDLCQKKKKKKTGVAPLRPNIWPNRGGMCTILLHCHDGQKDGPSEK